MTLRLLIDMNLSPSWVEVLREAGFEAVHWYHIGAPNAPDGELFAWARENKYIDLPTISILALCWQQLARSRPAFSRYAPMMSVPMHSYRAPLICCAALLRNFRLAP